MSASYFSNIPAALPDPILGVAEAFRADPHPGKVNLGVGVYQDNNGRTPILESVKRATQIWTSQEDTKTYLTIDGVAAYNSGTQELLLGKDSPAIKDKRVMTMQAIGGTGALRLGAEIIRQFFPGSGIYVSDPSWENHRMLFQGSGLTVGSYPYYDPKTHGLKTDEMLAALRTLPEHSAVLLHACCHNPTGVDIDIQTWEAVAEICAKHRLIPFIDSAYQGFAAGLKVDPLPIRILADKGLTFIITTSYAKSFSMYRERCGALTVVTGSAQEASNLLSQMKRIVRTIYSSPASFGAQVVATVLNTPELRSIWESELEEMRLRILEMRRVFTNTLREMIPERDFSFIEKQRGMFSYSGLSKEIIQELRERFHIHALDSGRICVAAMNTRNIEYLCQSIATILKEKR
ncbi:MAG: aromatic amino acid transaminase [Pseudomonadota bacterium]|jgi:aromatic-amino-acid transaminase